MKDVIYVLPSAQERLDAEMSKIVEFDKNDAVTSIGPGIWFAGQLEQVSARLLTAKRPVLNGLRLFPISTEVMAGAQFYTRRMVEHLGYAAMISDYSDDLPAADIAVTEDTVPIKDIGSSFRYSIRDLEAGRAAAAIRRGPGLDIPMQRAFAARKANETKINNIVWNGDAAAGLFGVLTTPTVPRYAIGLNSATAAIDTLVEAICAFFNSVSDSTDGAEAANRLLMSAKLRNRLATRFRTNTDSSILDMVVKGCEGLASTSDIIGVHELDAAGDAGGDALIADRRDEGVMSIVLPTPLDQRPAQERNLAWVVNVRSTCGGVMSNYPHGMRIGEMTNAL